MLSPQAMCLVLVTLTDLAHKVKRARTRSLGVMQHLVNLQCDALTCECVLGTMGSPAHSSGCLYLSHLLKGTDIFFTLSARGLEQATFRLLAQHYYQ